MGEEPEKGKLSHFYKWWRSLRGWVAAIFGFYFILLWGAVFVHYWNINTIINDFLFSQKCEEFVSNVLEIRRYEKNFFLYHEKESYPNASVYLQKVNSYLIAYQRQIKKLIGLQAYLQFTTQIREYEKLFSNLYHQNYAQAKGEVLENKLRQLGRDIVNTSILIDNQVKKKIQKELNVWKHIPVIFTCVIILSIGLLFYLIVRRVIAPLNFIQNSTQQIVKGNFALFPKPKESLEEISTLIDALNKMMQELELRKEQLIQARKMASLGTFTAGIAHELNNPLNNIYITAEMFLEEYGNQLTSEQREYIEDILQQAQRASDIVANLLDFSRAKRYRIGEVDIKETINNVIKVTQNQIKLNNIDLKVDMPDKLPKLQGDPNSLRQVFINLIENAIQAMPHGGSLKITAQGEDGYLRIDVSDTGMGIPKEYLSRIFEPFFTTKEKGTGLGLAVTYGIIKQHGGTIKVKSELNKGTTFTILLPVKHDVARKT